MRPSLIKAFLLVAVVVGSANVQAQSFQMRPELLELMRLESPVRQQVCYRVLALQSASLFKMASDVELFTAAARKDYLTRSATNLYRSVLFNWSSAKVSGKVVEYARKYAAHAVLSEESAELHESFCNAAMAAAEKNGAVTAQSKEKAIKGATAALKSLLAAPTGTKPGTPDSRGNPSQAPRHPQALQQA